MENILILGGTGNIGFPLVETLSQEGKVKIVAGCFDLSEAVAFKDFPEVEVREFDFLRPATFETALKNIDRVFFIRPPQLAKPKEDMYPFLEKVKEKGIKHLVFVSLIGVEKNPMTPHHKIEKKIVELGIPHTFIRPSFFMQNLNTTHQLDIKEHHDLFIPAGNSKTSFIDTRDIGAVAAVCLQTEQYIGTELEITGAKALDYREIGQIMSRVLGTTITYSKPSLLHFRKAMLARGIKKEYVNVMVMLYLITQLGNAKSVTNTVEQVLGRPPIAFEQYVRDYRAYFE